MYKIDVQSKLQQCESVLKIDSALAEVIINQILAMDVSSFDHAEFPECKELIVQTKQLKRKLRQGNGQSSSQS
eukprot:Awhi_evm1s1116